MRAAATQGALFWAGPGFAAATGNHSIWIGAYSATQYFRQPHDSLLAASIRAPDTGACSQQSDTHPVPTLFSIGFALVILLCPVPQHPNCTFLTLRIPGFGPNQVEELCRKNCSVLPSPTALACDYHKAHLTFLFTWQPCGVFCPQIRHRAGQAMPGDYLVAVAFSQGTR